MTTTALSDAELLAQARAGDEAAFTELYVRHHAAARRLASAYPRAGDPDDLVNGAFERILGALRRGAGPDEAFRAYLFVTLRRFATDQINRAHDEPVDEVPEPVRAEEHTPALDLTERQLVVSAYESLPERTQAVLWQTEVEGRQPRELGGVLGMSANAAAALAYRAREKLRQAYLQAHLSAAPRPQCEPHRSRLGAYVREGLSARDQGATEAHLESCSSCRSLLAELTDVNRLLRRSLLPVFQAAASAGAGVGAGTAATAAAGGVSAGGAALLGRKLVSKARSNPAVVAGAVVVVAALAFALVASHGGRPDQPPAAAPEVEEAPPPEEPPAAPAPVAAEEPAPEAPLPTPSEPPPPVESTPTTVAAEPAAPAPDTPDAPVVAPPPPAPSSPPTTAPPPPPTQPPPPPALVVVWLDVGGVLQITLTNSAGPATDGMLLQVDLSGGALVAGAPSNCGASLALLSTVSCAVGTLDPGESVAVSVPVQVVSAASSPSASTQACSAPLLGLACLDVVAEVTTGLL